MLCMGANAIMREGEEGMLVLITYIIAISSLHIFENTHYLAGLVYLSAM